jgi:hypothetical protein
MLDFSKCRAQNDSGIQFCRKKIQFLQQSTREIKMASFTPPFMTSIFPQNLVFKKGTVFILKKLDLYIYEIIFILLCQN